MTLLSWVSLCVFGLFSDSFACLRCAAHGNLFARDLQSFPGDIANGLQSFAFAICYFFDNRRSQAIMVAGKGHG